MSINNEQDLQDHFHSIHDCIRDQFGLYGKSALQFFNFFFVLKKIERHIHLIKGFNCEYTYSKLQTILSAPQPDNMFSHRLR